MNAILKSKFNNLISTPGVYELQVSGVFPAKDRLTVNFKAVTPYHVAQIKEMLAPFKDLLKGDEEVEVDLDMAEPLKYALNTNFYTQIRATDYIPAKGEIVKVNVGWHTNKDGVEILVVNTLTEIQAKKAGKVSVDSLFEEEEIILEQKPDVVVGP